MAEKYTGLKRVWAIHRKQYEDFREQYDSKRLRCPKCGELGNYTMVLVKSSFNPEKQDEYRDMTRCTCLKCEDVHLYHYRISEYK